MKPTLLSKLLCSVLFLSPLLPYTSTCMARGSRRSRKGRTRKLKKLSLKKRSDKVTRFSSQVAKLSEIPIEEQLPFVLLIYGHNSAKWIKPNLASVFKQNYKNFRIIYVDDASQDETSKMIKTYLEGQYPDNFQLISHKKHQGKLKVLYTVINDCMDKEIVVLLDGKDWLVNEWVISNLCKTYTDNDIWLTYGSCVPYPQGCNIGIRTAPTPDEIVEKRHFRKVFLFMPLRSFYAWLFKQIEQEDLIDSATDDFYEQAAECHIMWPLLEMAHTRFKYIEGINYIVNCHDPITKLTEDYYLRVACNAQMGKKIPIYPVISKPQELIQ